MWQFQKLKHFRPDKLKNVYLFPAEDKAARRYFIHSLIPTARFSLVPTSGKSHATAFLLWGPLGFLRPFLNDLQPPYK